jgi:hypothetical protein
VPVRNALIGVIVMLVGGCTSATVTTGAPTTSTFPPAIVDPAPLIADFCGRSSDVVQQLHADFEMETSQIAAAVHHDAAVFRDAVNAQVIELSQAHLEAGFHAVGVLRSAFDIVTFRGAGGLDELRGRVRLTSRRVAAYESRFC